MALVALTYYIMTITKHIKEILVGKILGDAHLERASNGNSFRLKVEHASTQRAYVDWLYEKVAPLCTTPPKTRQRTYGGRTYTKYYFQTCFTPKLNFFGHQFYTPSGHKIIPSRIIAKLITPQSLAVWFMDDGSVKSHQTNGRILNTQSFSKKEVALLATTLNNRFGFSARPRPQRDGWQIFIPAGDASILINAIGSYILPSMRYKLPRVRNTMPKK